MYAQPQIYAHFSVLLSVLIASARSDIDLPSFQNRSQVKLFFIAKEREYGRITHTTRSPATASTNVCAFIFSLLIGFECLSCIYIYIYKNFGPLYHFDGRGFVVNFTPQLLPLPIWLIAAIAVPSSFLSSPVFEGRHFVWFVWLALSGN